MNNYHSKLMTIIDGIRPDMETLGYFAFGGGGDIDALRNCFIRSYEAALEAKKLYEQTFPDTPLPGLDALCGHDTDISPIEEFYNHLKSDDFMPMPFDAEHYSNYTMVLNGMFIALQQA